MIRSYLAQPAEIGPVQDKAQAMEMVMAARPMAQPADGDERWPMPVAALFIVGISLVLWTGIILAVRAVLG
jgi:hypothetical protein